jgi:GH24 family phage-related lysozyme (muramidase)
MKALLKRVKRHEALSLTVYPDCDKFAIGYGHQCGADHPPITIEQAEEYLRQDVYKASDQYMRWKGEHGLKLTTARDEVLCEMIFWHGFKGFLGFKKMIQALLDGDYETAADEMLNSDSGRKYFTRMYELSVLMREA